jgi:hypothetical protein
MTERHKEGRTSPRTSLFAAAVLDSGATRFPVRIRNISPAGALVQGNALPLVGSFVELVRGQLRASGDIRWSQNGKAGVSFTDAIAVEEWIRSCVSKAHQHGVDEIVATIRTGLASTGPGGTKLGPGQLTAMPVQAPGGILDIRHIVTDVAERLAADPAIVERHAAAIQQLDVVAAMLASIARMPPR